MEFDEPPTSEQLAALVHARTPHGSADARLRAAIALGHELAESGDALVGRFVAEARAAGMSWSEVGGLFGTSKQAAQKRYGPAEAEPGGWPGRWTPAARVALDHAGEQARELGHNFVGSEHLLLGLLAVREGIAAHVLADLGITRHSVLSEGCLGGPSEPRPYDCLGVMPRLKQALEHAARIAGTLGHRIANTEHLLAGILAVPDALAVEILNRHGVSADDARAALAQRLDVAPEQLTVARRRRRRLLAKTR